MENTINQFLEELESKKPIPGGGSVSALLGAISTALGNMVLNLSLGKKKYEEYEEENINTLNKLSKIQKKFKEIYKEDMENFELLSETYKIKPQNEEENQNRKKMIEIRTLNAIDPPLNAIDESIKVLNLLEQTIDKTTKLAISDIGIAALCTKSCLEGSLLNIIINTKMLSDEKKANKIKKEAYEKVEKGVKLANKIYESVKEKMI